MRRKERRKEGTPLFGLPPPPPPLLGPATYTSGWEKERERAESVVRLAELKAAFSPRRNGLLRQDNFGRLSERTREGGREGKTEQLTHYMNV